VTAALFSACAETFELHLSTSFGALAIVGNSYHNSISGSLYVHSLSVPLEAERLDREKEQVQNEARSRKMWLSSLHGSRMKNLELILLLVLPSISFGQDQPVPAQREMERERSPLVSIPPLRGGDFQGIGVYRSDVFWGRARKASLRAQHRLDEPTKLSLGVVASLQSPLPFHLARSL
jgi:hypothetical protein